MEKMSQDEFMHCGSIFLLFPYNSTDICIRKWVYNTVGNITNCCSQCFSRKYVLIRQGIIVRELSFLFYVAI